MKINIKIFFALAFSVLLLSCKENRESVVAPKDRDEIHDYMFASGNGVLKENNFQSYILFIQDTTLYMAFNIDDLEAVKIVYEDGLESGYFPWHVYFLYNYNYSCYVWVIQNQTGSKSGKTTIIDVQKGSILQRSFWRIFI